MKIAVIMPSLSEMDFGSKVRSQLIKAGMKTLGIQCAFVNPEEVKLMYLNRGRSELTFKDRPLDQFDLIINTLHNPEKTHSTLILSYFENQHIPVINSLAASIATKYKPSMLYSLCSNHIKIPKSAFVATSDYLDDTMDFLGGFPIVVKTVRGCRGAGVLICESLRSLRSVIQSILINENVLILQEYIAESEGSDYKIIATSDDVICSFQRQAISTSEFRANVSLGGKATPINAESTISELAKQAISALKLSFGSVDIIKSRNGFLVIEVNDLPEFNLSIDGVEIIEKNFAAFFVTSVIKQAGIDVKLIDKAALENSNPRFDFDWNYYNNLSYDDVILIKNNKIKKK